jgi:hypothetical protein
VHVTPDASVVSLIVLSATVLPGCISLIHKQKYLLAFCRVGVNKMAFYGVYGREKPEQMGIDFQSVVSFC